MYLISASDFQREFQIPNATEANSGTGEELNLFIEDKVRLFLQKTLGLTNFTALNSQITAGVLNVGADQKWKDLVNGVSYTVDGKDYRWNGLKYQNGLFTVSILVNYVYIEWLEWQLTQMTGVGEARAESKNAIGANSTQRLVTINNQFIEMYYGRCHNTNPYSLVNGVPFWDYYQDVNNGYVSMVQFLKDKSEDYPNAPYFVPDFTIQNQLGL